MHILFPLGTCQVSHAWIQEFSSGGVQVSLTKKKRALTTFFSLKSSAYFSEVKWPISKKCIIFQGSRGGPTFSRGGVQLFPGGSNCLFPIETHITCDFPRGGGDPNPLSPLWIHTCFIKNQSIRVKYYMSL